MIATVSIAELEAMLQAVGALASILGGFSGYAACLALFAGDAPDDIGRAVNVGLAIGFLPALVTAVYVYQQISTQPAFL
jgi:hypothetical protein